MRKRYDALIDLIRLYDFHNMLEVGVGSGQTMVEVCKAMFGQKFVYYGVDPFVVHDEYTDDINSKPGRIQMNKVAAEENFTLYAPPNSKLLKTYSMNAAKQFSNESLDLVFIDGNHSYEIVSWDLVEWWPKVRPGGILAGHDYDRVNMFPGVKLAVDQFVNTRGLELQFDNDIYFIER